MNAAMPELRSAVMILVDAAWEDAAGVPHAERARMEDKSAGGACLRLKSAIAVGSTLRVQWRFEQFSGVVKYCRAEGREFVVGIQREAVEKNNNAGSLQKGQLSSRIVASEGQSKKAQGKREEVENRRSEATKPVDEKLSTTPSSVVSARLAEMTSREAEGIETKAKEVWAKSDPPQKFEERRREARTPVSDTHQPIEPQERPIAKRVEASEERKTKSMKRKWLDLTPWHHKQEGPSIRGNGAHEASGGGRPHETTGLGGLLSAERMIADSEVDGDAFATDLMAMEDVYLAAGVMQPRGRGVHKVIEMLRSEHIRGASKEMKRAAVLTALEAAGISVEQIQHDAKARQAALDAYEAEQRKQADTRWAGKAQENAKLQADMERVQAQYMAHIARNLEAVAQEQALLRNWQTIKQQESQRITEAVEVCMKAIPESVPSARVAREATPVLEKADAAVAGAASEGGIKPS